jgi:hypothetical protein
MFVTADLQTAFHMQCVGVLMIYLHAWPLKLAGYQTESRRTVSQVAMLSFYIEQKSNINTSCTTLSPHITSEPTVA